MPQRREYLGIYDRCEGGLHDEVGGLYAGRFAYALRGDPSKMMWHADNGFWRVSWLTESLYAD